MGMIGEFRKFVMRGNVMDMAIGFTVGAAFTAVVKALVDNVIMPPVGLLLGGVDFKDKYFLLKEGAKPVAPGAPLAEAKAAGAVTLDYGLFINSMISLLIIALVIFIIIRVINSMNERMDERFGEKKPAASEPPDKKCSFCLTTVPYRATRCPACTSELPPIA